MINSAGLGGMGPEGITYKLLIPVSNNTSSKVALPLKKLLKPIRLEMLKCLATLGLRKSLSINTTVCPVSEYEIAKLVEMKLLPSPGTELLTSTLLLLGTAVGK